MSDALAEGITSKVRVLVVDDQLSVLAAVVSMLNARGFEAVAASSGEAALAPLGAENFDVMVCDVRMPGMSGLELLSHALEIDPHLPVLMLSAVSDSDTAREALKRGAMDYLTKPIEMDELDNAVRSAARYHRDEMKRRAPTGPASVAEEVTLSGGPLDRRRVRLESRGLVLWVVIQGGQQHVWAATECPEIAEGTTLLGWYAYSAPEAIMVWQSRAEEK